VDRWLAAVASRSPLDGLLKYGGSRHPRLASICRTATCFYLQNLGFLLEAEKMLPAGKSNQCISIAFCCKQLTCASCSNQHRFEEITSVRIKIKLTLNFISLALLDSLPLADSRT
jgi:hypothetical protein